MKTLANSSDKAELLQRLRSITPDVRPKWGKMTAQEMLCHCTDALRGPLREKQMGQVKGWPMRRLMKWFALSFPMPWPKNVGTLPEMDQQKGGTRPTEFEKDRASLMEALQRFSALGAEYNWPPHPIFLSMSPEEWMRWGYLHLDHHLRQFGA